MIGELGKEEAPPKWGQVMGSEVDPDGDDDDDDDEGERHTTYIDDDDDDG